MVDKEEWIDGWVEWWIKMNGWMDSCVVKWMKRWIGC